MTLLVKITVSVGALIMSQIIQRLLKRAIDKFIRTQNIKRSRGAALHKFKSFLIWMVTIILIVYVWGLGLKNVWVFISGILGIIAIGLVAVWSILSNIMAGFILFFTNPFKINDDITIMPEGWHGTVADISLFFVTLHDENENELHIPNNVVFQKAIKRVTRR